MATEVFLPLGADPALELTWDLTRGDDLTVVPPIPKLAHVKALVRVSEDLAAAVDRDALRRRILTAGAQTCVPVDLIVIRGEERERGVEFELMSTKEAVLSFADETKPVDRDRKVALALAVAAEADEGVVE